MKKFNDGMFFNPMTGKAEENLESPKDFRENNGVFGVWLFNPWNGKLRNAWDVGSDPFGQLINIKESLIERDAMNATSEDRLTSWFR